MHRVFKRQQSLVSMPGENVGVRDDVIGAGERLDVDHLRGTEMAGI